jgi:hypothetical protein
VDGQKGTHETPAGRSAECLERELLVGLKMRFEDCGWMRRLAKRHANQRNGVHETRADATFPNGC